MSEKKKEVMRKYQNYDKLDFDNQEKFEKGLIAEILTKDMTEVNSVLLTLIWRQEIQKSTKKYPIITDVVFQTNTSEIDSEYYEANIDRILSYAKEIDIVDSENAEKYMLSLSNHIKLAISQKDYINRNMSTVEKKLDETKETLKNVNDTKGTIYAEFVTILGIFTTIIFAVFGGFQQVQTLGVNLKETELGKLLFFLPLFMLGINFLVFLSFNAISKIIKKPIKSCGHDDFCSCSFSSKHPTIYGSSIIFIWVSLIGASILFFNSSVTINSLIDNGYKTIILLVIIILPFIALLFVKVCKCCNEKKRAKKGQDNKE